MIKMGENFNIDASGIIHDLVIGKAYTTYLGENVVDKDGNVVYNDAGNPKKLGRPMYNEIDCEGMPFADFVEYALDRMLVKARTWQKDLSWDELRATKTMKGDEPVKWDQFLKDKTKTTVVTRPMTVEEVAAMDPAKAMELYKALQKKIEEEAAERAARERTQLEELQAKMNS